MAAYQQETRFDARSGNLSSHLHQHHQHRHHPQHSFSVQQPLVAHAPPLPPPSMMDTAYDGIEGGKLYAPAQMGYYVPPHAPRLTAAAARASTMAAMYYNPSLHPQHGIMPMDQGAPWAFSHARHGYKHPQQHQQIESQLLMNHQLSKLQGPPPSKSTGAAFGQGYEAAAAAYGQQQHQPRVGHESRGATYPHHQQQQQQQQQQPHHRSSTSWESQPLSAAQSRMSSTHVTPTGYAQHLSNAPDSYFAQGPAPPLYPTASAPSHVAVVGHAGGPHHDAQLHLPHPAPSAEAAWVSDASYIPQSQYEATQPGWTDPVDPLSHHQNYHHQQQHEQQQQPAYMTHTDVNNGGDVHWMQAGQPRANVYGTGVGYAEKIPSDGAWVNAQAAAVETARVDGNDRWHLSQTQQQIQPPTGTEPHSFYNQPSDDFAARQYGQQLPLLDQRQQPLHGLPAEQQPVQGGEGASVPGPSAVANQQAPADNHGGPAPPSPATLDKSAVPISNIGAEIVWLACAALLEPDLLLHCLEPGGNRSRYSPMAYDSASPYQSSPATSPISLHKSGKSMDWSSSAVRHPSPLNPHEHTRREEQTSSQRQGNARLQKLLRNGFDGPLDGTLSSEDSSASSSEPGTPPSASQSDAAACRVARDAPHDKPQRSIHGLGFDAVGSSPLQHQLVSNGGSEGRRSSRAVDHSREAVANVLRLISPDWKWSVNDDVLPSLAQSLRDGARRSSASDVLPVVRPTYSSMHRSRSSSTSPTADGHGVRDTYGAALPGTEVSPAFRRFAHQVLAQTLVSPTAFMLSLMYALRAVFLALQVSDDGSLSMDAEAFEIFGKPHSAAPFKILTLGLMIANKHLDDNTFLNKTWNEVTGIPLAELNRMERWYLEKSGYEITVPEEPWVEFLELMRARTERKIAATKDPRHIRTQTTYRTASDRSPPSGASLNTSHVDEETCKRLLMSIEESLAVLGRVAPFELNGKGHSPSTHSPSNNGSPMSTNAENSGNWNGPTAQHNSGLQDGHAEIGRMVRPQTALHLHHHCHSAPASALDLVEGEDIFDEEDGPYRPQPRPTATVARKSVDQHIPLSRWNSDQSRMPSTRPGGHHPNNTSHPSASAGFDAPLAPSILLDLLNRGQQHAHAAS